MAQSGLFTLQLYVLQRKWRGKINALKQSVIQPLNHLQPIKAGRESNFYEFPRWDVHGAPKAASNVVPYFLPFSCFQIVWVTGCWHEVKKNRLQARQSLSAVTSKQECVKVKKEKRKKEKRNRRGTKSKIKKNLKKRVRKAAIEFGCAPPAKHTHSRTHKETQTGPHVVFKHLHWVVTKTSHTIVNRRITTQCQEVSANNQVGLPPLFVSDTLPARFRCFRSIFYSFIWFLWSICAP